MRGCLTFCLRVLDTAVPQPTGDALVGMRSPQVVSLSEPELVSGRLLSHFAEMRCRKFVKTEARKKKETVGRAVRALQRTKARLGLGEQPASRGVTPSPLVATSRPRTPNIAPTSDRIPGPASARDLLHEHKWKQGAEETEATTREMRRKATQIAPAYNKGALQYLPKGIDTDEWPPREQSAKRK